MDEKQVTAVSLYGALRAATMKLVAWAESELTNGGSGADVSAAGQALESAARIFATLDDHETSKV